MPFKLDERLQNDCIILGKMSLTQVLLMNDVNYPWLILVPMKENLREVFELSSIEQKELMNEVAQVSQGMSKLFNAKKMNIGALGNIVEQLHIHIIARQTDDQAWPGPVWGAFPAKPYSNDRMLKTVSAIESAFKGIILPL